MNEILLVIPFRMFDVIRKGIERLSYLRIIIYLIIPFIYNL